MAHPLDECLRRVLSEPVGRRSASSFQSRLAAQLDALDVILAGADSLTLVRRSGSGQWSALENLAHLGRYHEVFLERLERIRGEVRPLFLRYRAEDDPAWPAWAERPADEVLARLRELRTAVVSRTARLAPSELVRTGVHPVLGELTIPLWGEFFLAHEGHHLYTIFQRLREPR
ncbi:MAG: hypothetical protein NVS4B3_03820 [Gemmatimonadaceae bacterium]